MNSTPMNQIFKRQQQKTHTLRRESPKLRLPYLKKLKALILKYEVEIISAHQQDFNKPANETLFMEIFPVMEEINLFIKNLSSWSQPITVPNPSMMIGSKSQVLYEPKGTVLILAPWNYPFALSLVPLVGAIGAGNTVCLKPSELTPQVSSLLKKLIGEVFPTDIASVFEGAVEVSQELLELPFDHIFFTGSTQTGRLIMQAAAKNLTPVTLELGGKSPVIVDSSANLQTSAEKIMWGKSVNDGQTCVSPDYVYVQAEIWEPFIDQCRQVLNKMQKHHDRPQIITERHFQRQLRLLSQAQESGAKILNPQSPDEQHPTRARDMAPILIELTGQEFSTELMQSEIFGPLLPLIKFESLENVFQHINSRGKPLALYIFSQNQKQITKILQAIPSGGAGINSTLLHVGNHHLPFGGIGASGMGRYHGWYSFLEFSHQRAVLTQRWTHALFKKFYPPYSAAGTKNLGRLLRLLQG